MSSWQPSRAHSPRQKRWRTARRRRRCTASSRIIVTSNDVIHAFMVPSFGIKQDAIPGFVRDTWFRAEKTGDFYG